MSSIDRCLPFIARACLVLLFPFSALDKIFDYGNAVAQADASGLAMPGCLLLLLGGYLEVFGSLGILLNISTMAGGRSGNDADWLRQPNPSRFQWTTLHPPTSTHNPC